MTWYLLPHRKQTLKNFLEFLDTVWTPNWFAARSSKIDFAEIADVVSDCE